MSLARLRAGLARRTKGAVEARADRGSVVLEGRARDWNEKMELGWYAAEFGFRGVVNDIEVAGCEWAAGERPLSASEAGGLDASTDGPGRGPGGDRAGRSARPLEGLSFDVAVIGGGVIGCAIARELARWKISVVLLEKEEDVAVHTSSRNDGMIHDGFAAKPGSLKAKYNVLGNRLWEPLAKDLGIDFSRPGSLIVFSKAALAGAYPVLAARAAKNGVDGWEYWSPRRVRAEEPDITEAQHGGFFLPSAGILSPYRATVALAESAAANGVTVSLDTCVKGLEREGNRITRVLTTRGDFRSGVVVNAAGNWADVVAAMADDRFFSLHQRRGVDMILDEATGRFLNHIMSMPAISQTHTHTKGGGLVKTIEGNILVGPTATEAPGREGYGTHPAELRELEKHFRLNRKLAPSQVITYFAGVRPCTYEEDFIVERSERIANLVHAAGIQSPGLASAPAIAAEIARLSVEALGETRKVVPNEAFIARRRATLELKRLPLEERAAAIARNPAYGRIVCRCEEVSEGEIRDVLHSPVPALSLDAVKRRARAGMGRCHGGFCTPRVMEIMADELGLGLDEVTKKGPGSRIALGETKGGRP
jgi:glycerol-3-phosphate dehydrogenase